MIKSFEFFSDKLNKNLTVEINIGANKDESWIESMEITDETFETISEKSLGPDELRAINSQADEMANDFGYEAWQEHLEGIGDFAYDQMRDAEMLDNNSHFSEEMHNEMELASMADELMNEPDGYMISEDENN